MDYLPPHAKLAGFAATETTHNDELAVATRHCAALLVSSADATRQTANIKKIQPGIIAVADHRTWRQNFATPEMPTLLEKERSLFGLEDQGDLQSHFCCS